MQPEGRLVQFAPVLDIPFPRLNLADIADPIAAIIHSPEFVDTKRFFAEAPSRTRSLLSEASQALLYSTIRNLKPDHVLEIGTYQGGTAEALSRALQGNGHGMLHTVSPFDAERFGHNFAQWPEELRRLTRYYPVNSMTFFIQATESHIRPGVVLVDGNHDFEFAAFDIWSAARLLTPGGFIFVDNVAQAGPYRAGVQFLAANFDWRDCGERPWVDDDTKAFDPDRSRVPDTDFLVLRAPFGYFVGKTPKSFGEINWHGLDVNGLTISPVSPPPTGVIKVQCIVRAFSEARVFETITEADCALTGSEDIVQVEFKKSWAVDNGFDRYSIMPWLCWLGDRPLELKCEPTLF
jgi:predicted O-methyltransferase YrrM